MLQIYLRLPEIGDTLRKISSSEEFKLVSAEAQLFEIIDQAFRNWENDDFKSIPIINMNPFRVVLGNEYSTTFPYNQPGDAHSFWNYLNNVLNKIDYENFGIENPLESTLKIKYLRSSMQSETDMDTEFKSTDYISFEVHDIIYEYEKSKSCLSF